MKIRIDFFKKTGKWYTTEELNPPWPETPTFDDFLRKALTTTVEGKARVRYGGMTAVCLDWNGIPRLTTVPTDVQPYLPCVACKFEAEHGSEECPHPVDARAHECQQQQPGGAKAALVKELIQQGREALEKEHAVTLALLNHKPSEPLAPKRRSCNRHGDCDAAEMLAFGELGYKPNFHCHDDDCEDCFPK